MKSEQILNPGWRKEKQVELRTSIACVRCGGPGLTLPEDDLDIQSFDNTDNTFSPAQCYNRLLMTSNSEFTFFIHDDVTIHDPAYRVRIETLFDQHPECMVIGLGGATGLGHPDIYKKPYNIWQMARRGYMSNQTDWQTHGGHETGERRVAVVDAFFIAVRTEWVKQIGGWPTAHISHHGLDLWLCLEVARRGKKVWMVGAECTHHGGGTSTKPVYEQAKWLQGGTLASDHQEPHRWLYDQYRDVLPVQVQL